MHAPSHKIAARFLVLARISEDVIKLHNVLVQLLIKADTRRGLISGDTLSQVSYEPHRRKAGGIIRPRNSSRTFAASRVSMGNEFVSDKFQPPRAARQRYYRRRSGK